MKININYTVEVDEQMIGQYMEDCRIENETIREFVKSHMIASGIGVIEDTLHNNGFSYAQVDLIG